MHRQIHTKSTYRVGRLIHVMFQFKKCHKSLLHPFLARYQLLLYSDPSFFFFLLNGTATGMVAFVIVNKSKILCVKLWEKTIKGRALVEPV